MTADCQYAGMYSKISERMFYYAQMDMRTLRVRYRNINEDIPYGVIANASRTTIIKGLACNEFGFEAVDEYSRISKEWDATYPNLIELEHRCPEIE